MAPEPEYRPRLADARLTELIAEFPAILVIGPRAVGKTTTARRFAAETVRLDSPAEAGAFLADPDAALRGREEPVLLDEWQEVPEVLGAVRRAVDSDPRPGRFLLTGSVRAALEQRLWPGTGRLVRLPMYGLAQLEVRGSVRADRRGFVDLLAGADPTAFSMPRERPRLHEYLELALCGGFPEVVLRARSERATRTWLDSYLEQLLSRDSVVGPRRDSRKLRRYFEALALSTAGTPSERTLYDAAGVNAKTANAYDRLLEDMFVAERLPAWATHRLQRLVHAPKRYIVDSGVAAAAAGLTGPAVLADSDLLGRLLDTFVVSQLRPEVALSADRMRLHHLRTKEGRHEVDLVIELGGGAVIGLECKSTASPNSADARHLRWLRDALGECFVAGAVIHTGPDVFVLDERILAVPICALWG